MMIVAFFAHLRVQVDTGAVSGRGVRQSALFLLDVALFSGGGSLGGGGLWRGQCWFHGDIGASLRLWSHRLCARDPRRGSCRSQSRYAS